MLNAVPLPTGSMPTPGGSPQAERSASSAGGAQSQRRGSFSATLEELEGSPRRIDANGQKPKRAATEDANRDTVKEAAQTPPAAGRPKDEISPEATLSPDTDGAVEAPSPSPPATDAASPVAVSETSAGSRAAAKEITPAAIVETVGKHPIPPEASRALQGQPSRQEGDLRTPPEAKADQVIAADTDHSRLESSRDDSRKTGDASPRPLAETEAKAVTLASRPKSEAETVREPPTALKDGAPRIESGASTGTGSGKGPLFGEADVGREASRDENRLALLKDASEKRPAGAIDEHAGREPSAALRDAARAEALDKAPRQVPSDERGAGPTKTFGEIARDSAAATMKDDGAILASRAGALDSPPTLTPSAGSKAVATAGTTSGAFSSPTPVAEAFAQDNFHHLVERALFSVRGGQSEARIALKPERLGHVHMRIVTENHAVSIKIVAESPAARDLIDANAHQLRAELQQQGLNVQSIDVSVADDHQDAHRGARQREAFLRHKSGSPPPHHGADEPAMAPETKGRRYGRGSALGIDYFA